jgi:hypothetical protein
MTDNNVEPLLSENAKTIAVDPPEPISYFRSVVDPVEIPSREQIAEVCIEAILEKIRNKDYVIKGPQMFVAIPQRPFVDVNMSTVGRLFNARGSNKIITAWCPNYSPPWSTSDITTCAILSMLGCLPGIFFGLHKDETSKHIRVTLENRRSSS